MKPSRLAIFALLALASTVPAADSFPVLSVPAPDRVVVQYQGLPVGLSLAHLDVPLQPAAQAACQDRLTSLVKGKKVEVVYKSGFGVDAQGIARVQLLLPDKTNVNDVLVAGGFARYKPGTRPEPQFDEPIRKAQERAKSGKSGVWSGSGAWAEVEATDAPDAPANAPASAPIASAAPSPAPAPGEPAKKKGPFCSELDSKYYYPSDHRAVANVNPQRLIYYPDEASAKRANKMPSPSADEDVPASDGSESGADAVFAKGKDIYAQAISKGNTPERDQMYEKAFVVLSKAMQQYSALCEKKPNDEKLGEKLRECMQLRYGSVKQRRFE